MKVAGGFRSPLLMASFSCPNGLQGPSHEFFCRICRSRRYRVWLTWYPHSRSNASRRNKPPGSCLAILSTHWACCIPSVLQVDFSVQYGKDIRNAWTAWEFLIAKSSGLSKNCLGVEKRMSCITGCGRSHGLLQWCYKWLEVFCHLTGS